MESIWTRGETDKTSFFVQVAPASSLLWVKVISLGYLLFFWFHLSIFGSAFCFFLFYSFCTFKTFVNYCNKIENLSPELALPHKSEHSKGRLLA